MRLWSLNPAYLDARGLVAVWREALLAQAVLRGKTRGYRNHPQLIRFKNTANPAASIGCYLNHVYREARRRGYSFNQSRIIVADISVSIPCTEGQIKYEWGHLLTKLKHRDRARYEQYTCITMPDPHPMFTLKQGPVEPWERVRDQ